MHGVVEEVVRLTPSMVRVVLGGDGLADFEPTPYTDQYVNALFVPDGASYTAPFDVDEVRGGPPEHRPMGRRYTIRSWNPETRQVAIDFVVHGDVGFAGRWANNAKVGDTLQIVGPSGAYAPSDTADWHLMVGDESALPAIAASLERVRPGVPVVAIVVVDGPEHELPLDSPGSLDLRWVHRDAASGDADPLLAAVVGATFPAGIVDVFVHGEAAEVRSVRRHLLGDRGIPKNGSSISPYWRRTLTDEQWRAIKGDWVREMNDEA